MGNFHQNLTLSSAQDRPMFSFPDNNLVNFKRFSPNLVYALIFKRSGLGLLMGKLISSDFDRVICPRHAHIFVYR